MRLERAENRRSYTSLNKLNTQSTLSLQNPLKPKTLNPKNIPVREKLKGLNASLLPGAFK